jgi:hypothetical protein
MKAYTYGNDLGTDIKARSPSPRIYLEQAR